MLTLLDRLAKVGCLAGVLLHLLTIGLAYETAGTGKAAISAVLPVLAEFYWAYQFGLQNWYTLTFLAIVALYLIVALGVRRMERRILKSQ
jgi:hypothetical protein